jgi:hypothetical protein
MSILALTSNTLIGTPAAGNLEYDGQFFGTDSNASRAQMQRITQGTAVSLSGTSVEFTSLPAWVKRITVMLYSGVSSNGTSNMQVQIGSGSYTTSGYTGAYANAVNASATNWAAFTTGFAIFNDNAPDTRNGTMILTSAGSNTWVSSGMFITTNRGIMGNTTGFIALGGVLDRLRLTTVGGDTFDAGSVNIIYEG